MPRNTSGLRPPWKPGQSGNPGGRPKSIKEVIDLARQRAEKALTVLEDVMQNKKASSASRVAAASVLLERGYGKPSADIHVNVKRSVQDFTDDELAALASEADGESGTAEEAPSEDASS